MRGPERPKRRVEDFGTQSGGRGIAKSSQLGVSHPMALTNNRAPRVIAGMRSAGSEDRKRPLTPEVGGRLKRLL